MTLRDELPTKDNSLDRLVHVLDEYDAISKLRSAQEERRALRAEKDYAEKKHGIEIDSLRAEKDDVEKKHRSEINSLREILRTTRGERDKYRNMTIELAGKQISMEEYEKKTLEQTKIAHKQAIDQEVDSILKDEARWPEWFTGQVANKISRGISNGLNATFWSNIRAARNAEWPKYLEQYTRTKLTRFLQSSFKDQLASIAREVCKKCDKCGEPAFCTLEPKHIEALLTTPHLETDCPNPNCRDRWGKHKIVLGLGDVIWNIIGQPTQPTPATPAPSIPSARGAGRIVVLSPETSPQLDALRRQDRETAGQQQPPRQSKRFRVITQSELDMIERGAHEETPQPDIQKKRMDQHRDSHDKESTQ